MMHDDRISPDSPVTALPSDTIRLRGPSIGARLIARLRPGRFDAMLAVGAPAPPGSPLAVHAARITSRAERESLAGTLRTVLRDARASSPHTVAALHSRVPLDYQNVVAAADLIETITLRLNSPRPVSERGMARLRRVVCDGCGPLYRYGRGDLSGRLGAALAEL